MTTVDLYHVQREMVLAHKRGAWDTVVWLAGKARPLRLRESQRA